ncbi:class I SAM-dependent methyltransferase [Acidithiobacillus sp. IBUN Pt1247-S3]|uniref:class I SAM-dependent methyltransferase n=1 Tax=Acidithiobacillus sp. IBUN Pt1247-S3 TaxID=3166642 RepID=UPI0034E547EC
MGDGRADFVTQWTQGRKANLPLPDPEALAHSAALTESICRAIVHAGGWLPFAEYMDLALYAPGLGYYMAGQQRLGAAGDFITAPEMGGILGAVLARAMTPWLGRDGVLELGGGSGALATQIHTRLPQVPYTLLELSPDLQARQRAACPASRHVQKLPTAWNGVLLANEVLDAIPVAVVEQGDDGILREMGVVVATDGALAWAPAPDPASAALQALVEPWRQDWPAPYRSEVHPRAEAWLRTLAGHLQSGAILLIDYGHEAREYYHPQRQMGTLRAYYRHQWLDDPFVWPGLCDLTAHVNFTGLLRVAEEVGLHIAWYGNLARFLIEHGLPEVYAELHAQASSPEAVLALNNEIKKLTLPQEMGESFKVLLLTRGGLGGRGTDPKNLWDCSIVLRK